MDKQKLTAILSEPTFDPTIWLYDALVDYMTSNYSSLVIQPQFSDLLIPILDVRDIGTVLAANTADSISKIADKLGKRISQLSHNDIGIAIGYVIQHRQVPMYKHVVNFISNVSPDIANAITIAAPDLILTMLQNWSILDPSYSISNVVQNIMKAMSSEQKYEALCNGGIKLLLTEEVKKWYKKSGPLAYREAANIFFSSILGSINTVDRLMKLKEVMASYELINYDDTTGAAVIVKGFNELVCSGCGTTSTSKSGITLHIKSCNKLPPLVTQLENKLWQATRVKQLS